MYFAVFVLLRYNCPWHYVCAHPLYTVDIQQLDGYYPYLPQSHKAAINHNYRLPHFRLKYHKQQSLFYNHLLCNLVVKALYHRYLRFLLIRYLHLGFNTEFVVLERLLGAELLLKHRIWRYCGLRQSPCVANLLHCQRLPLVRRYQHHKNTLFL